LVNVKAADVGLPGAEVVIVRSVSSHQGTDSGWQVFVSMRDRQEVLLRYPQLRHIVLLVEVEDGQRDLGVVLRRLPVVQLGHKLLLAITFEIDGQIFINRVCMTRNLNGRIIPEEPLLHCAFIARADALPYPRLLMNTQ
jgi:hypothetical protein